MFIALLRGVNVGKGKRVPMAQLRSLLGELDHGEVTTLLNSGNAVFRSPARSSARHAAGIAEAISTKLNLEVPVIVKSAQQLADIANGNPFAAEVTDPSRLLVAFAPDAAALSALAALAEIMRPPDRFFLGKVAAYLHCPDGILDSAAGAALLGKVGRSVTTRNWATVLKLRSLASEP